LNPLKKLAGQTAIYGLSSIVPRFLNYFLVPIYASVFSPESYGIVADLYGLVVILNIILTYGMETAYFWFSKNESDSDKVYSTALISLFSSSILFVLVTIIFSQPIALLLDYPNNPEYIWWFGFIIASDALCSIPFVKLRKENKAIRFASIKISSVVINILLNVLFLIVFPKLVKSGFHIPKILYNPNIGVGYIFIANIISSLATLVFLFKDFYIKFIFDKALLIKMLKYSLPLLVAGLAGSVNDVIDRQFLKYTLPEGVNAMEQLGIYFANMKIAVILIVFIQTFRFAAEPFFFNYEKEKDSKTVFADIMKYFVLFCLVIFIGTLANLQIIKYFIPNESYWVGLNVVPIILLANLFVGIYINLSIWYKLSGKTMYGAYIIVIGSLITILLNFIFVSKYGYMASAYARLICYVVMTVICFVLGQKYYKIPYDVKKIVLYFVLAIIAIVPFYATKNLSIVMQLVINNVALLLFVLFIIKAENLTPILKRIILKK
jgi:O-antigen/teichoic acid export membrane protein